MNEPTPERRSDTVRLPTPTPYPQSLAAESMGDGARKQAPRRIQLDELLQEAISKGASDIHLHSSEPVLMRVNGKFQSIEGAILGREEPLQVLGGVLSDPLVVELREKGKVDFAFETPDGNFRFRGCVVAQEEGYTAVLRTLPSAIPSFEKLGLPPILETFTQFPKGLVLVTGPTGSGKSTTLAAMIDHINHRCDDDTHIMTIEDPIEFRYKRDHATFTQRAVSVHTPGFNQALVDALRLDPDVVLIGEMRDLDTVRTALWAAETGHLVFATLHTIGAVKTLDRIIGQFPANEQDQIRIQLSTSLRAVVSQILLPRCDADGRAAAFEIMVATPGISNQMRDPKSAIQIQNSIQTGRNEGMITLDDYLWFLLAEQGGAGVIAPETAIINATDTARMRKRISDLLQQQAG